MAPRVYLLKAEKVNRSSHFLATSTRMYVKPPSRPRSTKTTTSGKDKTIPENIAEDI